MLFLALSSSILNITRLNNYILMRDDALRFLDLRESNPAYLPELERIETHNQELVDDCTLKIYGERSPRQLNIREKYPMVAMFN